MGESAVNAWVDSIATKYALLVSVTMSTTGTTKFWGAQWCSAIIMEMNSIDISNKVSIDIMKVMIIATMNTTNIWIVRIIIQIVSVVSTIQDQDVMKRKEMQRIPSMNVTHITMISISKIVCLKLMIFIVENSLSTKWNVRRKTSTGTHP